MSTKYVVAAVLGSFAIAWEGGLKASLEDNGHSRGWPVTDTGLDVSWPLRDAGLNMEAKILYFNLEALTLMKTLEVGLGYLASRYK
ncbi:hypothetical protein CRG98_039517 [Punica granatum]|uniref:Uncharacterized protein n=1 Tax=Punica granatum TaxID=22663 RepID=A0A2I0I7T3_PUNGR|nr:hypothetical protein CRG98_039517 [Punica granatum]